MRKTGRQMPGTYDSNAAMTSVCSVDRQARQMTRVNGGLLCTISQPSAPGSTPQAFFPCYDHNGNIEKVISGSGAVVASFQYDAFGNTIQESVASGLTSMDFPVRFSTKYFDVETGLAYYGYR